MPTGAMKKVLCTNGCGRKIDPRGMWRHTVSCNPASKPKVLDEPKPPKRQTANWTITFVNGPTQIAVRITDKLASRMIRLMMGD